MRVRALAPVGCSNPSRDRKTGSDSSTAKRSAIGVSVTGGSSEMTIINGWPVSQYVWHAKEPSLLNSRVPSIGQNLQPFIGNGDVSIWVKNFRVGRWTPNKQTKIHISMLIYTLRLTNKSVLSIQITKYFGQNTFFYCKMRLFVANNKIQNNL